jgi:hypothetical protein
VIVIMNLKAPQTTSASPTSLDAPGWPGGIAPSPLLPGDDETEYAKFTAQFLAVAKPRDFIEEMLARDVLYYSWETYPCADSRPDCCALPAATGSGASPVSSVP